MNFLNADERWFYADYADFFSFLNADERWFYADFFPLLLFYVNARS